MTAERQPLTPAERTALCRSRKRAGGFVSDPVDVSALAGKKLVEHELASPEELADKKALADILSDWLDCWARGTLAPPH